MSKLKVVDIAKQVLQEKGEKSCSLEQLDLMNEIFDRCIDVGVIRHSDPENNKTNPADKITRISALINTSISRGDTTFSKTQTWCYGFGRAGGEKAINVYSLNDSDHKKGRE